MTERIFSLRLMGMSVVYGTVLGIGLGLATGITWGIVPSIIGIYLYGVVNGDNWTPYCVRCGHGIRVGYQTCGHCGTTNKLVES